MRIKGEKLNSKQREQVLAAYIYRWTNENKSRAMQAYGSLGTPTMPTISDEQWIAEHCFHFLQDGSRLMLNRRFCDPVYLS